MRLGKYHHANVMVKLVDDTARCHLDLLRRYGG